MNNADKYSSEFKTEVVLKALKGKKTQQEIAEEYGINAANISTWKKTFLEKSHRAFETTCRTSYRDYEMDIDETKTRVRKLRMKNGYSLKQVSDMLGVRENVYIRYENDPMNMPGEMIARLAKIYQISSDYLLGLSDSPEIC